MALFGPLVVRYRDIWFPFACLCVFLPGPRIGSSPLRAVALGLSLALVGQLIRATTHALGRGVRGGNAKELLRTGLQAHSRNPLHIGSMLILSGVALGSNSWACVTVSLLLLTFMYSAVVAEEENFLRGKFGAEFDDYKREVPRWLPRWSGLPRLLKQSRLQWRRALTKERRTVFRWIVAFALLTLWHLWRDGKMVKQAHVVQLATTTIVLASLVHLKWLRIRDARRHDPLLRRSRELRGRVDGCH